jgi:hypothetical protein
MVPVSGITGCVAQSGNADRFIDSAYSRRTVDSRDHHRRIPRPASVTAAVRIGSAGESAPTASCAMSWQQVCIGRHYGGQRCEVHGDGEVLRFWVGDQLVKPQRAPAPARYEPNGPYALTPSPNTQHRVSGINRHRTVNDQPALNTPHVRAIFRASPISVAGAVLAVGSR